MGILSGDPPRSATSALGEVGLPIPGPAAAKPAAPQVCRITDLLQTLAAIRDMHGDIPVTVVMGQLKGALVDVRSVSGVKVGTPAGSRDQIVLLFAAKGK